MLLVNSSWFLVAAKPTTLVEISGFFFLLYNEVQKKVQTVQTNMVAYAIWATNFKSEVRCDLRGCLEAIVASKPHFLCCSPIDGSSSSSPQRTNRGHYSLQTASKVKFDLRFGICGPNCICYHVCLDCFGFLLNFD